MDSKLPPTPAVSVTASHCPVDITGFVVSMANIEVSHSARAILLNISRSADLLFAPFQHPIHARVQGADVPGVHSSESVPPFSCLYTPFRLV